MSEVERRTLSFISMELTTFINMLQWFVHCNGKRDKTGNIHLSLSRKVYVHILCMLLLNENILYTLYIQRRHKMVGALKGNAFKVRYKPTSYHVLTWSCILESLCSSVHLHVKEIHLYRSSNWKSIVTHHHQEKTLHLLNITNGKIVCKHSTKGKMKHFLSLKETYKSCVERRKPYKYICETFVQRRKSYKHICLSKESDIVNGLHLTTVLYCFLSTISTNIYNIRTNQTQKYILDKLESRLTNSESTETTIRTTVKYSYTRTDLYTKNLFEESRKCVSSERRVHRYKTKIMDQCMNILPSQVLSDTLEEINQEKMFSSKAENKMFYLYGLDMHQDIQVYPVQQFSLEQAFTLCAKGGQTITNPEVFFSNNLTRLSSYSSFPSKQAPSAIKLSKAGFYATGNDDETSCFYCGCRHSRWRPDADPVQIHKDISPECEFIQEIFAKEDLNRKMSSHATNGILCSEETEMPSNLAQTGDSLIVYGNEHLFRNTNIESKDSLGEGLTSHCDDISMANSTEDFQNEHNSYNDRTGSERTCQMESQNMTSISHGFQTISFDNIPSSAPSVVPPKAGSPPVSCNFCIEKVQSSDKSDQPKKRRDLATNSEKVIQGNQRDKHKDFTHPLFPQYTPLPVRMSSFAKWPIHAKQTPKEMSHAGFFYKGYGDAVACFWCGVSIVSWEDEDDPYIEHVKWQPLCPYTIRTKGQDFVDLVLEQQGRCCQRKNNVDDYNVAEQTLSPNIPSEEKNYTKLTEMGFKQTEIDAALCKVYRQKDNPTEEDIVEQLLTDDRHEETAGTILPTAMSFHQGQEPWNVTKKYNYAPTVNSSEDRDHLSRLERLMCKICMTEEVNVTFLPCGHLVCCMECSGMVSKCPVCRARIENRVKSYIS